MKVGIATIGKAARITITSATACIILHGRGHLDGHITMIVTNPQQIMPISIKEQ